MGHSSQTPGSESLVSRGKHGQGMGGEWRDRAGGTACCLESELGMGFEQESSKGSPY